MGAAPTWSAGRSSWTTATTSRWYRFIPARNLVCYHTHSSTTGTSVSSSSSSSLWRSSNSGRLKFVQHEMCLSVSLSVYPQMETHLSKLVNKLHRAPAAATATAATPPLHHRAEDYRCDFTHLLAHSTQPHVNNLAALRCSRLTTNPLFHHTHSHTHTQCQLQATRTSDHTLCQCSCPDQCREATTATTHQAQQGRKTTRSRVDCPAHPHPHPPTSKCRPADTSCL